MKILLCTTDQTLTTWDTLSEKLDAVNTALAAIRGGQISIEIKYVDVVPLVDNNGRIAKTWFDRFSLPHYLAGNQVVALHMSEAQKSAWGIKPSLRGSTFMDRDEVGEFYFWADEHSKRGTYNQFIEVFLHELRHVLCEGTGLVDDTHELHGQSNTITGSFGRFDLRNYRPRSTIQLTIIVLVTNFLSMFKAPTTLLHPVEEYKNLISQPYGERNTTWYPRTGHHIGVDYVCPENTPVLAPWDGEVIAAGSSPSLGNYCYYFYVYNGVRYVERWMHLRYTPPLRSYKRGNLVAHTGNTGTSTNPHLHQDIWIDEVRLDLIIKTNWKDLTVDPQIHYEIK